MRVHIVTPANRTLYVRQLDQMHRQRQEIFVQRMGWKAIDSGEPLEVDQFDHQHAVYMLLLGDVGEVLGSARLLPTWKEHMFQTVLAPFVEREGRCSGAGVWELSRWIAGPGHDRETDAECRGYMVTALAEFALTFNAEAIVACTDPRHINLFAELGWPLEIIGGPKSYGEGDAIAVRCAIRESDLDRCRHIFRLPVPATTIMAASAPPRLIDPRAWAIIDQLLEVEDPDLLEDMILALTGMQRRKGLSGQEQPGVSGRA